VADILKTGEQWLAAKTKAWASTRVEYTRVEASTYIKATKGRSEFDVPDVSGAMLRVETHDFIVQTDDLVLDGIQVEPAPGDRIIEAERYIFEVSSPAPGLPHWRWSGAHRLRRRIHTKYVGEIE
jgi:hypothetical protein